MITCHCECCYSTSCSLTLGSSSVTDKGECTVDLCKSRYDANRCGARESVSARTSTDQVELNTDPSVPPGVIILASLAAIMTFIIIIAYCWVKKKIQLLIKPPLVSSTGWPAPSTATTPAATTVRRGPSAIPCTMNQMEPAHEMDDLPRYSTISPGTLLQDQQIPPPQYNHPPPGQAVYTTSS